MRLLDEDLLVVELGVIGGLLQPLGGHERFSANAGLTGRPLHAVGRYVESSPSSYSLRIDNHVLRVVPAHHHTSFVVHHEVRWGCFLLVNVTSNIRISSSIQVTTVSELVHQ